MQRYGYLPSAGEGEASSFTPDSITEAVRLLQGFAGLPRTGVLDGETKKVRSVVPSNNRSGLAVWHISTQAKECGFKQRLVHLSFSKFMWQIRFVYYESFGEGKRKPQPYKQLCVWSIQSARGPRGNYGPNLPILRGTLQCDVCRLGW